MRAIQIRIKKHKKDVVYNRINKLVVADPIYKSKEHNINFIEVKTLNNKQNYGKEC